MGEENLFEQGVVVGLLERGGFFMSELLRTYDISFDQKEAQEAYSREQFYSYIEKQMETHLGERFNVSLSTYEYEIKDGQLWGQDMDEPFIQSMSRGRDYRKLYGEQVDREREDAEVAGFEKIEKLLTDENTPLGTMMLSISPPGKEGSVYQHNFYDVFRVDQNEQGERFVEARRYSSALTIDEYREKISAFTELDISDEDPASSFLENPIAIQNSLTPDDLHHYLHKEHEYMDAAGFELIKYYSKNLVQEYADSLLKDPADHAAHALRFNAYLNKADEIAETISKKGNEGQLYISLNSPSYIENEIVEYGSREVRSVMTGCGASGGYEVGGVNSSPFSVEEFGKEKWEYKKGNCVVCKEKNTAVGPCSICKSCEKKFDDGILS